MIRIDRRRNDENGVPIVPNAVWQASAASATATAVAEGAAHKVVSSIYAHTQVRIALEKLFHDKCAYCETRVTASADWDVEHYRPKGAVAENAAHGGYYWLVYTWTNFYLACTFCNQRRQDKPRWGDLSAGPANGKHHQFPLSSEANRAMTHAADVDLEDPLLLAPCEGPDPEDHFRYTPTGTLVPRAASPKGKASIAVYHLNRRRLRDARKQAILTAVAAVQFVKKCEAQGNMTAAGEFRAFIVKHLVADDVPYAGAARAVDRDPTAFGIT